MTKTRSPKSPRPKRGISVALLALALSGCRAPKDPEVEAWVAAARPEARREARWLAEGAQRYLREEEKARRAESARP